MTYEEPKDNILCVKNNEDLKVLLRFYEAKDLACLILEMENHIIRLQNRVTELVNPDVMKPKSLREG